MRFKSGELRDTPKEEGTVEIKLSRGSRFGCLFGRQARVACSLTFQVNLEKDHTQIATVVNHSDWIFKCSTPTRPASLFKLAISVSARGIPDDSRCSSVIISISPGK